MPFLVNRSDLRDAFEWFDKIMQAGESDFIRRVTKEFVEWINEKAHNFYFFRRK